MTQKIGLTLMERLRLMDILPAEGNVVTLRMIRTLKAKLGPSAKEAKDFGIIVGPEPGKVQWGQKGNQPVNIVFEDAELGMIKDQLRIANDQGTLKEDMLGIYEKFMA